jgi:hypothetical protein
MSWDFEILGKVMRKRGMFTVVVPSTGDLRVVDICFMLITSKPKFNNPRLPLQELRLEDAMLQPL